MLTFRQSTTRRTRPVRYGAAPRLSILLVVLALHAQPGRTPDKRISETETAK